MIVSTYDLVSSTVWLHSLSMMLFAASFFLSAHSGHNINPGHYLSTICGRNSDSAYCLPVIPLPSVTIFFLFNLSQTHVYETFAPLKGTTLIANSWLDNLRYGSGFLCLHNWPRGGRHWSCRPSARRSWDHHLHSTVGEATAVHRGRCQRFWNQCLWRPHTGGRTI